MDAENRMFPTPDPELNALLNELVTGIQSILGKNFIAAYLQGSFAVGDWDAHSDVDFLVATDHEVAEADVPALQELHVKLYAQKSAWAQHLEGSYFPKDLLKQGDPAKTPILYLDNGSTQFEKSNHDNSLVVRWVVRERGIPLFGPDAKELIDLISANALRDEVRGVMRQWGEDILTGHWQVKNRWAQPFAVLSYCRMLHTLETGQIASKRAGAEWAQTALESGWQDVIQRAWDERPDPWAKVHQAADPKDIENALAFILYALGQSQQRE